MRAQPAAPETQLYASGQPGLPSSQQAAQQSPPAGVAGTEPLVSEPASAREQVSQVPQASGAETRAQQVPQAYGEVLGLQAPIGVQEELGQPVSPLPVGRMTQVRCHTVAPRVHRVPVKCSQCP